MTQTKEQIAAAFGGCTKCYGKGYGTGTILCHDIRTQDRSKEFWTEEMAKPCTCDRGKQFRRQINMARQEARAEALEEAAKIADLYEYGSQKDSGQWQFIYQASIEEEIRKLKTPTK